MISRHLTKNGNQFIMANNILAIPRITQSCSLMKYKELVTELDELLKIVGNDENHRLIELGDAISNLITSYEEAHHLKQSDLTEIEGKRALNLRQIKLLAKRFHVDPATFIDDIL
jgi:hypothetical protein